MIAIGPTGLVLVEDAHWLDGPTVGALGLIARRSSHASARAELAELEPLAAAVPSNWLRVGPLYARPLLAGDNVEAER